MDINEKIFDIDDYCVDFSAVYEHELEVFEAISSQILPFVASLGEITINVSGVLTGTQNDVDRSNEIFERVLVHPGKITTGTLPVLVSESGQGMQDWGNERVHPLDRGDNGEPLSILLIQWLIVMIKECIAVNV